MKELGLKINGIVEPRLSKTPKTMTQQSVYNLLKKKDEWLTAKEIAEILKINPGNVTHSLNKLYKHKEIMKKGSNNSKSNPSGFVPYYWRVGII